MDALSHTAERALRHEAAFEDGIASRLQDLALQADDAQDFYREVAAFSASLLAPSGVEIFCNITVVRSKRPIMVAWSTPRATAMDELQYGFGDGPCLAAVGTGVTVHVGDVTAEHRWPDYTAAVAAHGVSAILSIPLQLEGNSSAALNIYSSAAHGFSREDVARAEVFWEQSAKTLRLALRLAELREAKEDLEAAMRSRTAIDVAVGVIIAQNRCSQEDAVTILRKASNSRNIKLRDVATGVIASVSPDRYLHTHFDE